MQNIKARDVIAYATMPRVIPRIKDFFASGFGYVSFLMAQVFSIVRLLPNGHPYLMPENIGRYGFRHVIAQASKNLTFSYKNIDQIIVFFAVLSGIVILIIQIALLFYVTLISPVLAVTMFDTQFPQTDVAFSILHEVFGIPGIFCSLSAPAVCTDHEIFIAPAPAPFHLALYGLFEFYSTGLMMIAVLIFLYFLVVVIVETAVTGTPFGQRFQNFWVPIRLIVALGLLMPIDFGLSSGQYIVLYTAKYASGFATNGWNIFNGAVAAHTMFTGGGATFPAGLPLGERYSYVALPEAPDIAPLIEAMSLVHACAYAYHRLNGSWTTGKKNETLDDNSPYPNKTANYAEETANLGRYEVQAFLIKNETAGMVAGQLGTSNIFGFPQIREYIGDSASVPYHAGAGVVNGLGFYYGSDIIIRFGEFKMRGGVANDYVYSDKTGNVMPLCGDIRIPIADLSDPGGSALGRGGADQMQNFYYQLVLDLWFLAPELRQIGRHLVEIAAEQDKKQLNDFCNGTEAATAIPLGAIGGINGYIALADCPNIPPSVEWRSDFISTNALNLKLEILEAWENYVTNSVYAEFETEISRRGWGGAGIWYNKIAEINSGWMDGVKSMPYMERYPLVMEQVKAFKQQHAKNVSISELFDPHIPSEAANTSPKRVRLEGGGSDAVTQIAIPLYSVYEFWNKPNDSKDNNNLNQAKTDNPFMHAVTILMGTTGILNIRGANQHMHPLAQLVAIGKGLVNSAVINMAGATTGAFLGGLLGGLEKFKTVAGLIDAASSMFYSVAFIGLTAGFVLFYVLPFMPFLYFFFSVANWVKTIFEAMIGVPLWALAHMRIDGEGLPGDAAANGYFLLLEIFIRPILTVIALLAAIIIFATQVRILNVIWDLVTANTAGFTEVDDINGTVSYTGPGVVYYFREKLDQFFFTLVYTIVSYMLAMSSFKLIDKIPDNILRWAGAGVSAYGDIDQDNVDSLSRYAAVGGMTIGNQAAGAVMQLGKGVGGSLGGALSKAVSSSPSKT
ncbi:MAG: DotA/TraY family protein [Alphaproteobacteria bacterium]|nr:DotA/TraY family protein [Alphaproteobacteria bacterium]